MDSYGYHEGTPEHCEDKHCNKPVEAALGYIINGEYCSEGYCARHYYEHHYRVLRKCAVHQCETPIHDQFLTPPENEYEPAYGPYLCKEHFNELKKKCLVKECDHTATIKRKTEIQGEKVNYYLCADHAEDEKTWGQFYL
ncbi:MAG: hypothetical protein V3V74_07465 [Nitrosomonadaceae bacterium]